MFLLHWSLLKENRLLSFAGRVHSLRMSRPFSCQGLLVVSTFFLYLFLILFYLCFIYFYLFPLTPSNFSRVRIFMIKELFNVFCPCIYIYIYIWLNITDNFCRHILVSILSNCRVVVLISSRNWLTILKPVPIYLNVFSYGCYKEIFKKFATV